MAADGEPPLICRRLGLSRGWCHGERDGERTHARRVRRSGADGARTRRRSRLSTGRRHLDPGRDRPHRRDVSALADEGGVIGTRSNLTDPSRPHSVRAPDASNGRSRVAVGWGSSAEAPVQVVGSNRMPPDHAGRTSPSKRRQTVVFWTLSDDLGEGSGAAEGIRTPDPIITNDVLYRLSYRGDLCRSRDREGDAEAASTAITPDGRVDTNIRRPLQALGRARAVPRRVSALSLRRDLF